MDIFLTIGRGILGLVFLLFICYLFSANRKNIDWKLVGTGVLIQILFGLAILRLPFVTNIFQFFSDAFVKLINLSHEGTAFIFGRLADPSGSWAYVFAVQVLPNIIFFAALSSVLYYLFALHMLTQSIISAPAAIVCAKMLFPQEPDFVYEKELEIPKEKLGDNLLDAISLGTTDGLKLAVNVGAMLIVFTAMMAVLNYTLFKVGDWTHINPAIAEFSGGRYQGLTFSMILGYIFAPVAWLIGVNSGEMIQVGQLLGEKTIINEFQAYITFRAMKSEGVISDPKSILIATYALCGFANFASIGIQIGGISQLAPNQRNNLTTLGMKALLGGTIACLMCATIAGMILG
ncbi:MAG: hypothetical protein IPN55_11705 [Saprospiraceae bacterium]|nr:hypothetical protein [Candidatus Brachybacter algidus]